MTTLVERVLADYSAAPQTVDLRLKLNIRDGASRSAAIVRKVTPLDTPSLVVDRLVEGEAYLDNDRWYREANTTNYFWAGGVAPRVATPVAPPAAFQTPMIDGRIAPLSDAELRRIFGDFRSVKELPGGFVQIIDPPNWESTELVAFSHPVLDAVPCPRLRVHRKAEASFKAVFDAIATAGKGHLVLECAGSFVARHKGSDVSRGLSSHSWGVAIDLNTRTNPYRANPAPPGTLGSVHELLPFFAAQGFAWGGHFSVPYRDGMHFELARRDL